MTKQNIHVVIVSYMYGKHLDYVLKQLVRTFKYIYVATQENDTDTIETCNNNCVEYTTTPLTKGDYIHRSMFYRNKTYPNFGQYTKALNGQKFNKEKGINACIDLVRRKHPDDEWILQLDADTLIPTQFKSFLDNLDLNPDYLYGAGRSLVSNKHLLDINTLSSFLDRVEPCEEVVSPCSIYGYFNLFSLKSQYIKESFFFKHGRSRFYPECGSISDFVMNYTYPAGCRRRFSRGIYCLPNSHQDFSVLPIGTKRVR